MGKLMPTYTTLLKERLQFTGRNRRPEAWRAAFKREWRQCQVKPIPDRENPRYDPLPYRWVCSCPAFSVSRFLICKHLVQSVHIVPATFFHQVTRERSHPVWRHIELRPIDPPKPHDLQCLPVRSLVLPSKEWAGMGQEGDLEANELDGLSDGSEDDAGQSDVHSDEADITEEEDGDATARIHERQAKLDSWAFRMYDLGDLIAFNKSNADPHVLQSIEKNLKSAGKYHEKLKQKERRVNSQNSGPLSTFCKEFAALMFFTTRPPSRILESRRRFQLI
jgi:hypothetical protein